MVKQEVKDKTRQRVPAYLVDGSYVLVPEALLSSFVGIDEYGNPIVRMTEKPFTGKLLSISNCCGAFDKGLMDDSGEGYIGCRSCYKEVEGLGSTYLEGDIYIKAEVLLNNSQNN